MSDNENKTELKFKSRRKFLSGMVKTSVLTVPLLGSNVAFAQKKNRSAELSRRALVQRAITAFQTRREAAANYLFSPILKTPINNGDERRYNDYRANFSKTLPHNNLGEVDQSVYRQLRRALVKGNKRALFNVPLSSVSDRGLTNPLAAYAYDMIGPDSWSLRMDPAPKFNSKEQAAEMVEVYWQALTRDVPFLNYDINSDIASAVADLNLYNDPFDNGIPFSPSTLFRGETGGDLAGPYLSQFLWQSAPWGVGEIKQSYLLPLTAQDFGITKTDWLAIQRGVEPSVTAIFDNNKRYISTGRDLAEYVHGDAVYQAYLTAALVMLSYGSDAFDENNPYLQPSNQIGFVTMDIAEILDLVATTAQAALKAAWFQKWLVHRRLRPEVFAGRVDAETSAGKNYGIYHSIYNSEAINRLFSLNGNLLLPLAYPEGSPTHPSYPAGHATVAGACVTILKALFNESYEVPNPVQASADGSALNSWTGEALTLGGELNKLASNISLGRDAAGVHYRSDGIDGMGLGEQLAIGVLKDYASTRAEDFSGFNLTRFNGEQIQVGG